MATEEEGREEAAFRVLRNSRDFEEVLQQAGEASRRASEYLDGKGRDSFEASVPAERRRPESRKQLFFSAQSRRSMAEATVKFPKTPRDAGYALAFVSFFIVGLFVPSLASHSKNDSGLRCWLSGRSGAVAVTSGLVACLVVVSFIFDPRRGRRSIFALAAPTTCASLASLTAVAAVAASSGQGEWVVLGFWGTLLVGTTLLRAAFLAFKARKSGLSSSKNLCSILFSSAESAQHPEAFFDAVLGVVVSFFKRHRPSMARLIFGALSLWTAYAIAWTSARAFVREQACQRHKKDFVLECLLFFHLYWTSEV